MLTIFLLVLGALFCVAVGFFLGTHLEYTQQTKPLLSKATCLLEKQDEHIDRLLEDIITLGTICRQQQLLKEQYAAHLQQQEAYPSLTLSSLN